MSKKAIGNGKPSFLHAKERHIDTRVVIINRDMKKNINLNMDMNEYEYMKDRVAHSEHG
jgi:hypothetical protein